MYKLTRPDGFDFYSGTINYREAIGSTVSVLDCDPPDVVCGKGLHACDNPNDCFIGARIPCAAFRVEGVNLIAKDGKKSRFKTLKVVEEIFDLNTLFGWNYTEAINPVHPFRIKPPEITDMHINLLKSRDSVGASVWDSVGASVWAYIGSLFPGIQDWEYAPKVDGYPYQPVVDLWKAGLVPSFDGTIWRLHGGNGTILWSGKIKKLSSRP